MHLNCRLSILLFCIFILFIGCEKDYEEVSIVRDVADPVLVEFEEEVPDTNTWDGIPGKIHAVHAKGRINDYDGYATVIRDSELEQGFYYIINRPGDCNGHDELPYGEVYRLHITRRGLELFVALYENNDPDNLVGVQSQPGFSIRCVDSTRLEIYEATDTRIRGKYVSLFQIPGFPDERRACDPGVEYDVITIDFDVPVICITQ